MVGVDVVQFALRPRVHFALDLTVQSAIPRRVDVPGCQSVRVAISVPRIGNVCGKRRRVTSVRKVCFPRARTFLVLAASLLGYNNEAAPHQGAAFLFMLSARQAASAEPCARSTSLCSLRFLLGLLFHDALPCCWPSLPIETMATGR
jgi:hypothetical protein